MRVLLDRGLTDAAIAKALNVDQDDCKSAHRALAEAEAEEVRIDAEWGISLNRAILDTSHNNCFPTLATGEMGEMSVASRAFCL